MTSYISLLNKIEAFCNAHLQIKKYKGEFREQMPNFATTDEKYPVVFVVPTSDTETLELNQFTLDIYCVDIIQKDRANLNTIVSDCHLILKDLYLYFKDGSDLSVDVITDPTMTPLNNFDLDYVAGWVMSITFEVEGYSVCAIPMNPIPPFNPSCEDATYEITDTDENVLYSGSIVSGGNLDQTIQDSTVTNSDDSYTGSVLAEGSLTLPDITVTDSNGSTYTQPSVTDVFCTPCEGVDVYVGEANVGTFPSGSDVFVKVIQDGLEVIPEDITVVDDEVSIILADTVPPTPRSTATLMKTGQTTSYRTGDDGDIEAGRLTNFLTLDSAPLHNNGTATINTTTNRFTDILGGQTYATDIVLDWSTWNGSTLLGYQRSLNTNVTWNNAIDNALLLSLGGFSGWRLTNINELLNIVNWSLSLGLNYAPFSHNSGFTFHQSTTQPWNTAFCLYYVSSTGSLVTSGKDTTSNWKAVRTFSLSTSNVLS